MIIETDRPIPVRCKDPRPHRRVFSSETGVQTEMLGILRCTCGSILVYDVPQWEKPADLPTA